MKNSISSAGHAIISGGSSGIGLAIARVLVKRGISVSLLGRSTNRLIEAKRELSSMVSEGARVVTFPCDVTDVDALATAVQLSVIELGAPTWAIACAGIVMPGIFLELPLHHHLSQLRTNYLGTLHLAYVVVPLMVENGGGRLLLVASGAAIAGIYGYSAYCPSKFAIRGLAETLAVELKPHSVSVTLAYPPDTNTPQLAFELPLRPNPTQLIADGAGVWEPEQVALALVRGAERNKFIVTIGWKLNLLNFLHSVIAPLFRRYQDWAVRRFG
jgi:3-dehydrosphinganine reductase